MDRPRLVQTARNLAAQLSTHWPSTLRGCRAKIPAAFRNQDLSHFDVFKLGDKIISRLTDRERTIVIVGFRTAGSYFVPLLRAYLKVSNYADVRSVTVRPMPPGRLLLPRPRVHHVLEFAIEADVRPGDVLLRH